MSRTLLSDLTFHNIRDTDKRVQALCEAVRVLHPGGWLYIVDGLADRYALILQNAGCVNIEIRHLDRRTRFGLPDHYLTLVLAKKFEERND